MVHDWCLMRHPCAAICASGLALLGGSVASARTGAGREAVPTVSCGQILLLYHPGRGGACFALTLPRS